MNKTIFIQNQNMTRCTFQPPKIPASKWCDFRKDYESGMTLLSISRKYYCDPRTVKSCIMHNKPSAALGKHMCSTKLTPYCDEIDKLLQAEKKSQQVNISRITHHIYVKIKVKGYSGCERTVRNYINQMISSKKIIKERKNSEC